MRERLPAPLLSQDKQHCILEAAKQRFYYYGVSKTTMRDIAEDLGMSVSNLYLYFQNKREIVLAIADDCRALQDEALDSVLSNTTLNPAEKLESMLVSTFQWKQRFRDEAPKGKELLAYLFQEFPSRIPEFEARMEARLRSVLDEGNASGYFAIPDIAYTAHMLRLATAHFFLPATVELPIMQEEEDLIAVTRWFLNTIRPVGVTHS